MRVLRYRHILARPSRSLAAIPFGVDAAFGDVLKAEPDVIIGTTFLDFVGVMPAKLRVYPREAHVAEKLHAYTLPRTRKNSRVKDYPDLPLLAQTGGFGAARLREAIRQTFAFRDTAIRTRFLQACPLRHRIGARSTRAWQGRTHCSGTRSMSSRRRCDPSLRGMAEAEVEARRFRLVGRLEPPSRAAVDMAWVYREMRRVGVTLTLLWTEYATAVRDGPAVGAVPYGYSQFCELYSCYRGTWT